MIGCIFIFIKVKNINKTVSLYLIISSIVMLYISIFDLIPSAFNYLNKIYDFMSSIKILTIYVLFGGIFVCTIDKLNQNSNKLYKIGLLSAISLIIHNIPEGIITFVTSSYDISLGLSFAFTIALHNIPEGIVISIPIYYGEKSKRKAIIYTLIAALSEPFGAFLAFLLFHNINIYLFSIILSITSGIMLYLSIFGLLFEGIFYKKKKDVV